MNYYLIIDNYGQHIVIANDLDDIYSKDGSDAIVVIKLDDEVVTALRRFD
jgi:hypothetical protein